MSDLAKAIRDKALALGYENCGIISVEAVADYEKKLDERIARIPMGEMQYEHFRGLAKPQEKYPWTKSMIVLVQRYSVYDIPDGIDDLYAKSYLFDARIDTESPEYKNRERMIEFLNSLNIRHDTEPKFGLTALRLAAFKAGLGTIRRNNFFYTESGSYLTLEAILIDRDLEWIETTTANPCPANCQRCVDACPSKSLCAPYTMSLATCVSYQTSLSANTPGQEIPSEEMFDCIGHHLYGCDDCQDACPFNKDKWTGGTSFPQIDELLPFMRPERIMEMNYDEIAATLGRKFWYIAPENLWKWKINALTVMRNDYCDRYEPAIQLGLSDSSEEVRLFAQSVCRKLDEKEGSMVL